MNKRLWLVVFILFIPLLLFLPGSDGFVYPYLSEYSDITISHFPNLIFLRYWLNQGIFPFWSNTIFSGYPFAADPLAGLWYPPSWLLWVLPLPIGINWLMIAHLWFGGIGTFYLLRAFMISPFSAIMSGIAFELMPKLISHFGAGHMTLLFAVCWTPWLIIAAQKCIDKQKPGIKDYTTGFCLGMIMLADLRWGVIAATLWIFFVLWMNIFHENLLPVNFLNSSALAKKIKAPALHALWNGLFAITLSAPVTIPLAEFVLLSTRKELSAHDRLIFALPAEKLLGLLFPDLAGYSEWQIYPGGLILLFSIFASITRWEKNNVKLFSLIALLSIAVSSGLINFFTSLPIVNLVRVPARWMFLCGFSLCVLFGEGIDSLIRREHSHLKEKAQLIIFSITAFADILTVAIWVNNDHVPLEFIWGASGLSIAAIIIILGGKKVLSPSLLYCSIAILMVIDLGCTDLMQFRYRTSESVLTEGLETAKYLSQLDDGLYRIYSPSYSMPQQTAVKFSFELADGIDPMQLKTYSNIMRVATGTYTNKYSVTIPPFKEGNPAQDNRDAIPNYDLLGILNVKYILSEFDLHVDGTVLIEKLSNTRIYVNKFYRPRAWVQEENKKLGEGITSVPTWVDRSPNQVSIIAEGPGLLVISELAYPGWNIKIDDDLVPIQTCGGYLRCLSLPEGSHDITMQFFPISVFAGLILGLFGWLLIIFLKWRYA